MLVLAAVLFLGFGARTISAPFGDAHDGRNAGVWAAGSRSLREDGPVASRLGTRSPVSGVYANHPPLIYLETAVAELVATPATAATRAPAWVGSLVVIFLLARLLRERGLHARAGSMAVLLAVTTPMFLVYGTMLDTPVTSLVFAVALLLAWERARRGDAVRPLAAGVLAALAVLAGWQALLLAFVLAGWGLVRMVRRTGRRDVNRAFVVGAAVGFGLLFAWLLWAFGGTLRPLLDQFTFRTGGSAQRVSLPDLLSAQRRDAAGMFGVVGMLAVAGLLVALRDSRTRGLVAVVLVVTVPYSFVFRTGAFNHEYWGYWFVLPVSVGLAAGADRLLVYWRSRVREESVVAAGVAILACLCAFTAWSRPSAGESLKVNGLRAAAALRAGSFSSGQRTAWYAGAVGEPASWLSLATGRPAVAVHASDYGSLAGSFSGDLVLVGEVRCTGGANDHTYELRPAATLVDQPPVITTCG